MKSIAKLTKGIIIVALTALFGHVPAPAGTFVYVSNAEDGEIGVYSLQTDGSLKAGERAKAANVVMPMAVSPDRRFLYAAARSKPYSVFVYAIDPSTGALKSLSMSPLAESFPYISLDKTGRYLLGASYGANLISVNAVGSDGSVAPEPLQVIPVGRNAHSIRTDESNKFVFVPTLGSNEIFQFTFDSKIGRLASNTPAVVLMKPALGPRHFITSSDNKFIYVLSELTGSVTTFSLNSDTGLLSEVSSASGLPPEIQARARRAARRRRRTRRSAAAQHRQRHLGRGFASDTERQISLHDGAHQQFSHYVQCRWCERQAYLSGQYAHRETTTRLCD